MYIYLLIYWALGPPGLPGQRLLRLSSGVLQGRLVSSGSLRVSLRPNFIDFLAEKPPAGRLTADF